MKDHELKCWPEWFNAIICGRKSFEWRKFDRGFAPGDTLWLREWIPVELLPDYCSKGEYSGRNARVIVQDVWTGLPGMPQDYCIMEIRLLHYWKDEWMEGADMPHREEEKGK